METLHRKAQVELQRKEEGTYKEGKLADRVGSHEKEERKATGEESQKS